MIEEQDRTISTELIDAQFIGLAFVSERSLFLILSRLHIRLSSEFMMSNGRLCILRNLYIHEPHRWLLF